MRARLIAVDHAQPARIDDRTHVRCLGAMLDISKAVRCEGFCEIPVN